MKTKINLRREEILNEIDINGCICCKLGLSLFGRNNDEKVWHFGEFPLNPKGYPKRKEVMIKNGEYIDPDHLYGSPEKVFLECKNADAIEKYLAKRDEKTYLPINELDEIFKEQEYWWNSIIALSSQLMNNETKCEISRFIHEEDPRAFNNTKRWQKPEKEIEDDLIELAPRKGCGVK